MRRYKKLLSPYLHNLLIPRSHDEVGVNAGIGGADCVDLFLHIEVERRNVLKNKSLKKP